ncbi:MAG TPA: 6,7-dimethyl-8-ribityllumazine synthase [Dehalococcoidia bacterium]|nr:6,7-dimethyl-8-ribityllumazine synthase [Dehalococcoidia bacterium]
MNNKIAIIVSSFNSEITVNLYDGAINCLMNNDVPAMNIETYWVPGSLEIPYLAAKIASSKQFDGIIALGAVIKGDTYHYELVSQNTYNGCMKVSVEHEIPVTLGVIAADNINLAKARAQDIKADIKEDGKTPLNYGYSAAQALINILEIDINS